MVTRCDLNDPSVQARSHQYQINVGVPVVLMAPRCTAFGRPARVNKVHNYQAWLRSYQESAPHARFRGVVAKLQYKQRRDWLCEQPWPSRLFDEEPWHEVVSDSRAVYTVIDQCVTGLTGPQGSPVKKPTQLQSSDETLLEPVSDFIYKRQGDHEHPTGKALRIMQ